MTRLFKTMRGRLLLALFLLLALVATFPLRATFSLLGLQDHGVSARSLRGPVWWGGAEELQVGSIRLGTLDVFLSPIQLFAARARLDIRRQLGAPDDIAGAITYGIGTRGIDDVTGSIPLAAALAPLPVSSVELDDLSVRFSGPLCAHAEGRVKARVMALISGLNLANGLSGEARCDGDALHLPLVSQSGLERLDLRITGNGQYQATMRVRTSDPLLAGALSANGFRAAAGEQVLRITGAL